MERDPLVLTSRANPRFKALRAQLAPSGPKRTHTLLLGPKLVETWLACREMPAGSRLRPALWLRLEGTAPGEPEAGLGVDTLILGEALMRDLADAGSPPECALLAELGPEPTGPLPARVIVPWGIQDPGNLGAILRSAVAFGFQGAVLGPGCADPFAPKALRGSMGAAFLMPVRRDFRMDEGRWYALEGGEDSQPIADADLREPVRLLVGNEGHGWRDVELPPAVRRLAIPTVAVESLNAAVAAGIACYEVQRWKH